MFRWFQYDNNRYSTIFSLFSLIFAFNSVDCYLALFDKEEDKKPAGRARALPARYVVETTPVPTKRKVARTLKSVTPLSVKSSPTATAALKAPPKRVYLKSKRFLTEAQRQSLADVPFDLDLFESYLFDVLALGKMNVKLIMKQIRLFASGEGIEYRNWRQGEQSTL
jgi:hypothetical protein